jgi:hypothetical protein
MLCEEESTMPYASIGTISSGTLGTVELANTFAQALNMLARKDDDTQRKAATNKALAAALDVLAKDPVDESALSEFVNEIAPDLFSAYCPPFTYFGAHPGSDSDFGVWPSVESVLEAVRDKDGVVKVNAGDAWPSLAPDVEYVVEVNDHGNVTLFQRASREEIWSCV